MVAWSLWLLISKYASAVKYCEKHSAPQPGDLRALDGCDLGDHMEVVHRLHALTGFTCTDEELQRTVRCAAEVLLQTAPRLLEVRVLQVMASACGCCLARQLFEACIAYMTRPVPLHCTAELAARLGIGCGSYCFPRPHTAFLKRFLVVEGEVAGVRGLHWET